MQTMTHRFYMFFPALALMAWWNSANCWPNYMFNFVNRHETAGWSATTPLLYVVSVLYLLTPPVLWLLGKQLRRDASLVDLEHARLQDTMQPAPQTAVVTPPAAGSRGNRRASHASGVRHDLFSHHWWTLARRRSTDPSSPPGSCWP